MIDKNFNHKTYEDLSFTMDWPLSYKDIDQNIAASVREMYVKIEPSYNFYVKDYEDALKARGEPGPHGQGFPVYMLPNIYMFASELEGNFRDRDHSRFKKHITLNGLIPTTFIDIEKTMILPSGPDIVKIGEMDTDQHFERFGRILGHMLDYRIWLGGNEFDEYRNLIFPRSNLDLLKNHEGKQKLFPQHIEIEFTTDVNTKFANFLRDTNLTSTLIKHIIDTPNPSQGKWCTVDLPDSESDDPRVVQLESTTRTRYHDYPIWDLSQWINEATNATSLGEFRMEAFADAMTDPNFLGTFMGEYSSEVRAAMEPQFQLFAQLMMHLFKGDVEDLVTTEARPYVDLLRNDLSGPQGGRKFAHSETVFYKIEKMAGIPDPNDEGGVIWSTPETNPSGDQNIYFPNSDDIDILKYIDTQVIPDVPYRYMIWAYQLVIGNDYTYEVNDKHKKNNSTASPTIPGEGGTDDNNLWNAICIFCKPNLKLVAVPIYDSVWDHSKGIIVQDSPPVAPDVRIIPYQSVDDKILIWLNGNVGDFEMEPERIRDTDFAGFEDGAGNLPETIRFKSDEPITQFEIWRLDRRPNTYSDFAAVEPIIPQRDVEGSDPVNINSYIDKVQPNKKYYYTFRCRDRDKVSNPTAVYECELVKQDEFVYPIIRTIDMEKEADIQIRKPFKKFLQIKPSFIQSSFNTEKLDLVAQTQKNPDAQGALDAIGNAIEFDNPGSSVWDTNNKPAKKYKIRLHSKKSGKKIDINIDFDIDQRVTYNTKGNN